MAPGIIPYVLIFLLLMPLRAGAEALRIVSLYPGHTDNIVALGEEKRLAGISKTDDADMLPQLKRFSPKSSAEEILALKPDLVLTRSLAERQNPQQRRVLERAGVRVVSIEPPQWDEFSSYLRELASLIGCDPEAAEAKLKAVRDSISAEAAKRSKGRSPAVFVEATARELHTCSPGSWAAKLIELAGGRNAASDAEAIREGSAIAPYGLERILKAAASGRIDIYLVQQGAMNATDMKSLEARPWYQALKNIKKAVVPERELSRPSLPGLEAGGKRLIKIFYGE
ncbi:MAG: ABC transporter substrate-binding protein [Synergistes sp.]|nr:ABC transporter substrate-binding protein [Synergistes sp.]